MSQPIWKFIANLGDASPLDHGGYFVYEDTTGVYGFEGERIEPNEEGTLEIRRVPLDRLKEMRVDDRIYLVPFAYNHTWPHYVSAYVEWFADSLAEIADGSPQELIRMLCSANGLERAQAYREIYDHHGWDNGDAYPRTIRRSDAKRAYRAELASR